MLDKTAILKSKTTPDWFSCEAIRANVLASYKGCSPNINILEYLADDDLSLRDLDKAIKRQGFKKLIFIDNSPHPLNIITHLKSSLASVEQFCFYVYGNFTCNTHQWNLLFNILKNRPVKLIVASEAQKKLLSLFLNSKSQNCIEVCPFPVDSKMNILTEGKRAQLRKKYGFKKGDFILVYSGRITPEKNVNLALNFLKLFIKKNPSIRDRIKVLIAGDFEDHGQFFLNRYSSFGEYHHRWNNWFNALPMVFRTKIRLIGFIKKSQMRQIYELSDLFVSLSTFHDEDYGMSPIEALSAGCPALLSKWGGYSDFAIKSDSVRLTPVRIGTKGLQLNYQGFEKGLRFFIENSEKWTKRKQRVEKYLKKYSITAISERYKEIHQSKFQLLKGPSELMTIHSKKLMLPLGAENSLYSSFSAKDTLYKKIYSTYL